MPGKANSEDDQGAAAAAPADPKSDLTVAKVDGQGNVITPAGVLTLRDQSQLTLPIIASNHAPEAQQLVIDLQYLVHALQNAPKGQPIPLDRSRFNFNREAFDVLLRGLNLDDPTQQLALQDRQQLPNLPIVLRNTLAVDQGGHNITLLLQFIATLMQNQGLINLINTGTAIEAQNQSGRKIIVLPLEVLNAMRPLTGALQNEKPLALNVAVQNACAALADLTHNAVLAVNYQPCTHLAQAVQANPMLPVALFVIPMPIIQSLAALQPGQQQEVYQFTPELRASLLAQLNINAVLPAEQQIAQLQNLANLVRKYAASKPQQEQLIALLGSADRQALAVIPSIAGGANQETNEQRLWIAAVFLDALAAQLAKPEVPLSFFVIRNAQGLFDYGYASANSRPAAIMLQEGIFHAISRNQIRSLTDEQAKLLDSIGKMPRQALGQSTSSAGKPQQPAPQQGQPGWGAWFYNNIATQRLLTELLRRL